MTNKMRVAYFVIIGVLIVFADKINGKKAKENLSYSKRVEQCITKSQVAVDVVDEYREGGHMSNDENFKCYLQCMCNGIGHCDKNGVMLKNKIPKDIFNRIKDCIEVRGDNKCDTTYKQMLCMSEKA